MKALLACVLLVTTLVASKSVPRGSKDWWKHGTFYQIYPRSFKDSDGDGVGDLKGITSELGHLKDIGVALAWLSPIYKSPQVDAGYDISDYKDIHDEYGTMEDFEEMIARAKELDIKIIMDLVPNHSSDEHEWFKKSVHRVPGYEDYYVWADGKNNDDKTPPNNWLSVFKYSAWQYNDIRKQWYLHQFAPAQPDLNFDNPKIVEEMKDVMLFWMEKGVYGFRVDAVPFVFETGMEDEPPSGIPNVPEYEHGYLNHIYTQNQPKTYDLMYQFRDLIEDFNKNHPDEDDRIMLTEVYANIQDTMRYYGDGERLGAHFSFNFEMIPINSQSSARDIVMTVHRWLDYMPRDFVPNWVLGNHDQHRVASRVGVENVDGFNMLTAMLPGVAVTYNGEEIGMENGYVSWEQGQDPGACNGLPENFNKSSRDFQRTPFHWDGTKNAGFSTGDKTWLPVSEKYHENNLEAQKKDETSHYSIYKYLTHLRRESEVLRTGRLDIQAYNDNVIVLRRHKKGLQDHILVLNIGDNVEQVDIDDVFDLSGPLKVAISNRKDRELGLLPDNAIPLHPHESFVAIAT